MTNDFPSKSSSPIRTFETGATRNSATDKYDYEGFLSPLVLERFGQYMHKHRHLADGTLRASDNWQEGFPESVCLKSLLRHVLDYWKQCRGYSVTENLVVVTPEDSLCAIIFNAQAELFQRLGGKA